MVALIRGTGGTRCMASVADDEQLGSKLGGGGGGAAEFALRVARNWGSGGGRCPELHSHIITHAASPT